MADIVQWLKNYLQNDAVGIVDVTERKWCNGDYKYIARQYDSTKNPEIARLLGDMNSDGIGVEKNTDTAIEFYKIAIESKDPIAMNNLGYLYNELNDKEKAIDYYMMAIMNKYSTSLTNLLILYNEQNETQNMIKLCVFWYDTHKTVKPILKYCNENPEFFKEFMKTFSKLCESNGGTDNI